MNTELAAAHALVAEQVCILAAKEYWRVHRLATLDTEDLEQEAWLIVARLLGRHDPRRGPLEHYLKASMHWALDRALRRHRSERRSAAAIAFHGLPAGDSWHPRRLDDDVLVPSEALAQLPPREREVALLHVYGDQSFSEIAAALGIPKATASDIWGRAATRLRAYFAEERTA